MPKLPKTKKGPTTHIIPVEEKRQLLDRINKTEDIEEIIEISKSLDPEVRIKAAQQLCPCRVQDDLEIFWDRLFEMVDDEDEKVRYQILHNICDGSPAQYEWKVKEALDKFNHDSNKDIRRAVHKVIGVYMKTGEWNIM